MSGHKPSATARAFLQQKRVRHLDGRTLAAALRAHGRKQVQELTKEEIGALRGERKRREDLAML